MNPELIDSLSWEMAEVYGAITDQIMVNLARRFPYYNARNFPRSTITYQADMLAQMGQVNRETMAIIRNGMKGAPKALSDSLEQVIIDSVQAVNPELWQAVKKGIFAPPQTPVLAPNQYRAFKLYHDQAVDKLNLVNTVMLESTQQAYQATVADIAARVQATQTALDIGAGEVITGVSSWNEATRHAIARMQKNGITGFIDHGGHRWSAEAYTAMDIRTTMAHTGRAAVWETNSNFGNDLYSVSYHNGARPLCYPWQNKVISSTDNARTTVDLDGNKIQVYAQSATTYGEAAGLFGINCKHYPTPFIPGVSLIRGTPQDEKANARAYAESQQQRGLERKIREEKRDLLMLKAQGAPDDIIRAQREKIRRTDEQIQEFCDATGRARRQNREGVYTKREFPTAHTYDVATFTQKQKDLIDDYYRAGGAQQNYTFGQMTPKAPLPTKQGTPQASTAPNAPIANPATQTAQTQQQTQSVKNANDFAELKKIMQNKYGISITSGVTKLDFASVRDAMAGFESVAEDVPEVAEAIDKVRMLSHSRGVMSCNGSAITFNGEYFGTEPAQRGRLSRAFDFNIRTRYWVRNASVASIGAHETAHAIEQVLIDTSGKYQTETSRVIAWNNCTEARLVVEEAQRRVLATPYGQGKTGEELIKSISGYAAKTPSETLAEAFADCYANGDDASPMAKAVRDVAIETYRRYKKGE